jgi:hypothetical protein
MTWEVVPLRGVGKLTFGMDFNQLTSAIGEPDRRKRTRYGEKLQYNRLDLSISMVKGRLAEVGIATSFAEPLTINRVDFFADDPFAVLAFLERLNGGAVEEDGFVIFVNIGMALSGFHDRDLDQKAVVVFAKGHWDDIIIEPEPISFL